MSSNTETERIVVQYSPIIDWVLRVIILLSIFAILFAVVNFLIGFWRNSEVLGWVGFAGFLVLAVWYAFFDINFKWLIGNDITKVDIDFASRHVDLTFLRLIGPKVERYQFHQVSKFSTYRPKRLLRVEYYLQMTLINRKRIPLRIPIGRDKQESIRLIKRINRLMKNSSS